MSKPASKSSAASRKRAVVRPLRGTVFVTRQVHFNSGHRLHNATKSERWNLEKYGLCSNPSMHGHNYVLEVTVAGEPDPDTGYLIELGALKALLEERIVKPCDHRNLNTEVAFLRDVIPSTENLVIAFWHEIEPHLPAGRLHSVKLFETPRNFAEYRGPHPTA